MTRTLGTTGVVRWPAAEQPSTTGGGWGSVEGNARLTGTSGAALFVVLALEGITILQVRELVSIHVFIGMLLVPLVLLKTASTGYRFAHYYRGDPAYRRKGPPPTWLRLIGPLVVLTSLAVLGTGIATVLVGDSARWLRDVHKASFIVWFVLMAAHVLGHVRETPALAFGDVRSRRGGVPTAGAGPRLLLMLGAIVIGLGLGVVSLGWVGSGG